MANPWDFDQILERANRQAQRLYGVQAATRFKQKGESEDLLAARKSHHSPKIATLERAAKALDMSFPQLLGLAPMDIGEDTLDRRRLTLSLKILDDVAGRGVRLESRADFLAAAYGYLLAVETEHPDMEIGDESLRAIESVLSREFARGKNDRDKS